MKLNKLFFAVLLAITAFTVSCSKDEAVTKDPSKIDASDIMLSLEKGNQTISFYASADWTAALSTTSWIKIDPMTRAGVAGESKVIIEWEANTSIKERVAELTIAVKDENPVKIKITQLSEKPTLIIDKSELNLVVKPNAGNGRGQFVDTISVKSNIKWTLKNLPAWIEYSTVGDKEPQEGVPSDIQLIISADPKKFDQTVMSASIKLGAASNEDNDVVLEVSAETILKAVDADKNEVSKLTLAYSAESGGRYVANFNMLSNTSWKIKECPVWAQPSRMDNAYEYASNLDTKVAFWFHVETKDLDIEALKGNVVFVNEQTNTTVAFELVFPGTGADYFEYNLEVDPDAPFGPSMFDENWNEIPGATSKDFEMFTGRSFTDLSDAPFAVHFVSSEYGIAKPIPAHWANVEMKQSLKSGRAPLFSTQMTLYVNNRSEFMEPNPYSARYAYMIVTPADVLFDDLFEGDRLKQEYQNIAKLFGQNGLPRPPFTTDIPQDVAFTVDGGSQTFSVLSGPDQIGSEVEDSSWLSVDFKWTDEGLKIVVEAKPNTTGKARTQTATISEWVGEDQFTLQEFTVSQSAK
ncbi:MAG: BACON domain-containing protein [Bacteroidales bacterium]